MPQTTKKLYGKALELRQCARSWEKNVHLLGDVTAEDIDQIMSDYIKLRLREGISNDLPE